MLAPPKNKVQEGGVEKRDVRISSDIIIDRRYFQSLDFLLNFSKVFVHLENPEFRKFLTVLYKR